MYVSIFADPASLTCNNPGKANNYPATHRAHDGCHMHPRSKAVLDTHHELWYKYITAYINGSDPEDKFYLDMAMKHVSDTCPPDAPVARRRRRRRLQIRSTPMGLVISLLR